MTTKADRDSIREHAGYERVSRTWSKACIMDLCDAIDARDARIAELESERDSWKDRAMHYWSVSMTDQELNDAIVKILGMEKLSLHTFYQDGGARSFSPATDPAAAVWALERWRVRQNEPVDTLHSSGNLDLLSDGTWTCHLGLTDVGRGTFCQAICRAIVNERR